MEITSLPKATEPSYRLRTENPLPGTGVYHPVKYRSWSELYFRMVWEPCDVKLREYYRQRELDGLIKRGYIFRRTPVPGLGGSDRRRSKNKNFGIMSEYKAGLDCPPSLRRSKRVSRVEEYKSFDYDYYDYHSQPLRSWKRSKKRKQYM